MATEAKPPAELGPEGKRLWRSVARAVAEDDLVLDPRELAWLRTACKLADKAARLEAAIDEQELLAKGSNGQPVINSIWGEWRLICQLQAQTLARLNSTLTTPTPAAWASSAVIRIGPAPIKDGEGLVCDG